MSYSKTFPVRVDRWSEAGKAAARDLWLASLGAAVVTRDWVRHEAGGAFNALVHEGSAVEAQAIAQIGQRFESSMTMANGAWRSVRRTVESTVSALSKTAAALAEQAVPSTTRRAAKAPAAAAPKRRGRPAAAQTARKPARKPRARVNAAKR